MTGTLKEKGAVFILTALALPLLVICSGAALDIGSAAIRHVQLQNSADAAALAGGYYLDTPNKVNDVVQKYVQDNLEKHIDTYKLIEAEEYPTQERSVNYKADKSANELEVTLYSNVKTAFLKIIGITDIPVKAVAKAQISSDGFDDELFQFSIVAAHKSASDYNPDNWMSTNIDYGIWFHAPGMVVSGDVMTNGKIIFDQSRVTTLQGTIHADSAVKKEGQAFEKRYWNNNVEYTKVFKPDVWGSYGWYNNNGTRMEYYTFIDEQGNPVTTEQTIDGKLQDVSNSNKIKYRDPIDISVDNNAGIKKTLETYKKMSVSEREKNHIYYDDNKSNGAYKFSSSSTRVYPALTSDDVIRVVSDKDTDVAIWSRYYKIIVVPNDIDVSFENSPEPGDDDFAIIISLYGNIHIPNSVTFNGILYAPNGKITVDGTAKINGSIVAQQVYMTTAGQIVNGRNYGNHKTSSGSGTKSVRLVR